MCMQGMEKLFWIFLPICLPYLAVIGTKKGASKVAAGAGAAVTHVGEIAKREHRSPGQFFADAKTNLKDGRFPGRTRDPVFYVRRAARRFVEANVQGKSQRARCEKDLRTALHLDATNGTARVLLAQCLATENPPRLSEAFELLQAAIDPAHAAALTLVANAVRAAETAADGSFSDQMAAEAVAAIASALKFDAPEGPCPVCVDAPLEALASPCGHAFCVACLRRLEHDGSSCPMCNAPLSAHVFRGRGAAEDGAAVGGADDFAASMAALASGEHAHAEGDGGGDSDSDGELEGNLEAGHA